MRIRTQIVLAVVPLFLGLALVTGALTYTLQVRELAWGLREEATAIAVATARLVDESAVRRLAAGDALGQNPVRDQFSRVVRWGRARRLTLLSPAAGQRVLVDVAAAGVPAGAVTLPPGLLEGLAREPFAVGTLRADPGGDSSLSAFAPVRGGRGELLGVVAVETRAGTFAAGRAAILQSVLVALGGATLLGLLLAVATSATIARRLRRLTRTVRRSRPGAEPARAGAGLVEEVNDLVNTFDTLQSVLGEVLAKTERTLVEGEQFRSDDELAEALQAQFGPPAERTVAGVVLAGSLVGPRPSGGFFGAWESPEGGCAVVGTLARGDGLERGVAAAAALAWLREATRGGALAPALGSLADLFPLGGGQVLSWGRGGRDATRWSFDPAAARWSPEALELRAAAAPLVLHTLGPRVGLRLAAYVGQSHGLRTVELLGELAAVVDEGVAGAVLLARPAGVDAPAPAAAPTG